MAALVAGCGGGSGGTNAPATPATVCTPTCTIATPAKSAGTPVDAGTTGTLPFLTLTFGANSFQDVPITGVGTASVMTFTSPAFTLTGATGNTSSWSAHDGKVYADGNAVSYCSAGSQTTRSSDPNVYKPLQNGHVINISANLIALSDYAEIKNVTLNKFDCAGSPGTLVYDATGGVTNNGFMVTAADATQLTSINGLTHPDGSNDKVRGYKYVRNGVTKYFIVAFAQSAPGDINSVSHVALFY